MTRLRLFVYGPGNLLGVALACIGPLLLFTGVIDKGWWLVSASAYGAGWAAGALFFREVAIDQMAEMSIEDLERFLEKLLDQHGRKLPAEAAQHLQAIRESLKEALPRFQELLDRSGTAGREWLVFRQVILNYLPETLGNYLRLPATYAVMHRIGDTGKTPRVLLVEQLEIMDAELKRTVQSLYESDANEMLVNSRFLESKFEKATDFTV
jgi:hypothetical protein